MIKLNLEKALIKTRKKLYLPSELLFIKEYDKHAGLVESDVLKRVGLNQNIVKGENIRSRVTEKQKDTLQFNQDKIFHISQIKKICKKYRLKFLNTKFYKGVIDDDLPNKISNFEIAYSVKCDAYNTKIVAPPNSFKLEEKPKDPLFFYEINDEYYYLIHKWGNDLSVFRSFLRIFESVWFTYLSIFIIPTIFYCIRPSLELGIFSVLLFSVSSAIQLSCNGFTWIKKNKWRSKFKNN